MVAFKIASGDLTYSRLLERVGSLGRPVLLSTGAAAFAEVRVAVETLLCHGAPGVALLHCSLAYPTGLDDANLHRSIISAGITTPKASLTALASSIIDLQRASSAGTPIIRSRVAPVSTLIGLKQTLAHSLNQMCERISPRTGASNPASSSARPSASTRSDRLPSGSPIGNL